MTARVEGIASKGAGDVESLMRRCYEIIEAMPISEMVGRYVGERKIRNYQDARQTLVSALAAIDAALKEGAE